MSKKISNEKEYESAKQALRHAEKALLSLKKNLYPKNKERYQLLAESYIDYIQKIRNQIDEYTGLTKAEEIAEPLWISLKGPNISSGKAPISTLSEYLENFRLGVQKVTEYIEEGIIRRDGRPTDKIRELCNFKTRILPGSLKIGVSIPTYKQARFGEDLKANPVYLATTKILKGARWAILREENEIKDIFSNRKERFLILNQIDRITPIDKGKLSTVEFYGDIVRDYEKLKYTDKAQRKVKDALNKEIPPEMEICEGKIREIDLDRKEFKLRERPGDRKDLTCYYKKEIRDDAIRGLDKKVKIIGELQKDEYDYEKKINVKNIEFIN